MFWEYDSRIGRRWNVDPVVKEYESPYLCLNGNPILESDPDGDDAKGPDPEDPPKKKPDSKYWYIKNITKFKYNGTIESRPVENIPNAIGNGVINVINIVPALWNSGVVNLQSLREGTWKKDISGEMKSTYNNISDVVYNSVNYSFRTPLKKQATDFVHTLNDPQTLETAVTFAAPFGLKYVPNIKVLKSSGGQVNGFTVSRGGYGAKPRFDVHPLGNASKKSNTMPKWTNGKTLPHYHIGRGSNLHRHRPWEIGWNDKNFWDRFY